MLGLQGFFKRFEVTGMRWYAVGTICALVVTVSVTSTGCARVFACGDEGDRPAGLTREDMVGSYKADPFGTITLRADGTFHASDWPEFDYPNKPKHTGGGTGTWMLTPKNEVVGMDDDLKLDFTDGKQVWNNDFQHTAGGFSFGVTGSREKPRIYRFTTDPDICEFHTLRHA
ncbi:hypothetical protein [Streptomyces syringium]|uniref:hypothetical protein n=1 Tax=Streptomyces syringium TaxID=76729 RepID=UPI00341A377D